MKKNLEREKLKKKMFTILVLVILILPFESALASNNKTIIPNKLDTQTSSINNDVEAIINQIKGSFKVCQLR